MQYTHTISYKIYGISLPNGEDDILINENDQIRVILCSDTSKHSFHSDRGIAVGSMMLKGLTGKAGEGEFEDRLNNEIETIQKDRKIKYSNGPFVLFKVKGEADFNLSESIRDFGEFVIAFDAVEKETIKAQSKDLINQHLTSLFLIAENGFRVEKIYEGFYFKDSNKVHYSYTLAGSMTATISKPFTEVSNDKLKRYLVALNKHTGLDDINRLLIRASSEHDDKLRSFIFAWTALEVFFHKSFRLYEHQFLEKHTIDDLPVLAQHFFKRIKDVMKGKYSLRDKFIVIVSMLSKETEEDLQSFVKAKKVRDTFLHGENIDESALPIYEVIGLVRKYLDLHLTYKNP